MAGGIPSQCAETPQPRGSWKGAEPVCPTPARTANQDTLLLGKLRNLSISNSSSKAASVASPRWANGNWQHRQNKCKRCSLKRSLHRNSQRQNTSGRFKGAPCPPNHQLPYWGSKNSSAFGNVNPILVMFNFTSCVFVLLEEVKLMHCMLVLFPLIADLQTMSAVVWSDKSCLQDTDSPGD